MKILMVSWEYPPVVIGGLGRHVHHLSTALAAAGHDVVVLSRHPTGTDPSTHPSCEEISEGVRVIAASDDPRRVAAQGIRHRPILASRRRARPRLAGRPSDHFARPIL